MSVPSSVINICSGVKLTPSYEHTIFFGSRDAQLSYFMGKVVKTFSSYTYLRKEWSIKVDATMADAEGWNYLYFQNVGYMGVKRYYYYFITKVEYINEHTVELFLEMDVMQTYYFDYDVGSSFVDRCHSFTDEVGDNVIDEGLDLGEYVVSARHNKQYSPDVILMLSTIDLCNQQDAGDDGEPVLPAFLGSKYDGVFSSAGLFAVPITNWNAVQQTIRRMNTAGKTDAMLAMYMFPRECIQLSTGEEWNVEGTGRGIKSVYGFKEDTFTVSGIGVLNGYTPKNNKLLTSPFNLVYVTNNLGANAIYKYEKMLRTTESGLKQLELNVTGSVLPDGGIKLYPVYYNGSFSEGVFEEGISINDFPSCSWNSDGYKMWLAQNQNAHKLAGVEASAKTLAGLGVGAFGLASGNLALASVGGGLLLNGATSTANLMAQKTDAEIQPPQARGSLSGSVNMMAERFGFEIMFKTIRSDYAKRIDDYMTMYGYKQNAFMFANFKYRMPRQYWSYIKTVACNAQVNLGGSVPPNVLDQIRGIYDKGLTFWRDGDNIGNYGLEDFMNDNPIAEV